MAIDVFDARFDRGGTRLTGALNTTQDAYYGRGGIFWLNRFPKDRAP